MRQGTGIRNWICTISLCHVCLLMSCCLWASCLSEYVHKKMPAPPRTGEWEVNGPGLRSRPPFPSVSR